MISTAISSLSLTMATDAYEKLTHPPSIHSHCVVTERGLTAAVALGVALRRSPKPLNPKVGAQRMLAPSGPQRQSRPREPQGTGPRGAALKGNGLHGCIGPRSLARLCRAYNPNPTRQRSAVYHPLLALLSRGSLQTFPEVKKNYLSMFAPLPPPSTGRAPETPSTTAPNPSPGPP